MGLVKASNEGAWWSSPPMYQRARSDRPAYPASSKNSGSPPFQSDWWVCMPEPLSPKIGFGMNVRDFPCRQATFLRTYLNVMSLSAMPSSVSKRMPISP